MDLVDMLIVVNLIITLIWLITSIIADELNKINPWSKSSLKVDRLVFYISILWIFTLFITIIGMLINDAEVLALLLISLLSLGIYLIITKMIRWIVRKIYKEENK